MQMQVQSGRNAHSNTQLQLSLPTGEGIAKLELDMRMQPASLIQDGARLLEPRLHKAGSKSSDNNAGL